jgi:hypothetical protein
MVLATFWILKYFSLDFVLKFRSRALDKRSFTAVFVFLESDILRRSRHCLKYRNVLEKLSGPLHVF